MESTRRPRAPQLPVRGYGLARLTLTTAAIVAVATTLITTAGWDVAADLDYHRNLTRTGGLVGHSDAIYALAYYLNEQKVWKPVVLDWGIAASLEVITSGKIQPEEIFLYSKEPPPLFDDLLYKHLIDPSSVYVFRADDIAVFPRRQRFEYWVEKLEKTATLQETVRQRDGKPIYLIYTVT